MKSVDVATSAETDPQLIELVDDIAGKLQAGELCDIEDYVSRFPEHADRIRRYAEVMSAMADLGHSLADNSANRSGNVAQDQHGSAKHHDLAAGTIGDFRILGELGRGGMAVVYEAEQISLGRRVALKVLPFAAMLDQHQLSRFKNEARAAATLDHPNIVAIYSVGAERGVHYYAMQLIEGRSLAECIADTKPGRPPSPTELPPTAASAGKSTADDTVKAALPTLHSNGGAAFFQTTARLVIQAAEALDHAHKNGILHRDIKPANLLVDNFGKLWVTDFGLARIDTGAGVTMTGDLLGTLRYMSPEQALAKRGVVDQRSDIYSLGATLYELIAGRPPFVGNDRQELLRKIAFEDPPRPCQITREIPHDLETIVLKAIEKSPVDRYTTAQEIADDLRRFLASEPIHAKPTSALQRLRKWSRRNVTIVWAAAAVLLISTILLIVANLRITKWYREAEHHRATASTQLIETQKQSQATTAVSDLILEMLASANPDSTKGSDYTVRQLLDEYSTGLDAKLADQPDAKSKILATIGNAYRRLGFPKEAEPHLKAALHIRRSLHGSSHESVADSLIDYAWNQYDTLPRSYDEIVAGAQQAIKIYSAQNSDTERRLNALWLLQRVISSRDYDNGGSYAESDAAAAEALAIAGDLKTTKYPVVANVLHALSQQYSYQGKYSEAERYAEDSVAIHRRLHGDRHPETAWGLYTLGLSRLGQQRYSDAELEFRKAIAIFRMHSIPIVSGNNIVLRDLWIAVKAQGDLVKVETLAAEVLAELDREIEETPNTAKTLSLRAIWLERNGKRSEALDAFNKAVEMEPENRPLLSDRAQFHLRAGDSGSARADLEQVLKLSPDVPLNWAHVARCLATSNLEAFRDPQRAIELATKACKRTDFNNPQYLDTLAVAHAAAGTFEKAMKWEAKAIELARTDAARKKYQEHLKKIQQRQPVREDE